MERFTAILETVRSGPFGLLWFILFLMVVAASVYGSIHLLKWWTAGKPH